MPLNGIKPTKVKKVPDADRVPDFPSPSMLHQMEREAQQKVEASQEASVETAKLLKQITQELD